jgi:hypothetical protein
MKNKQNQDNEATHTSFPKKYLKHLPEGKMEELESMSADELKKKLVEYEQTISSTEKDMENDPKLESAKTEVTELSGAYKEILNAHKALVKCVIFVLEGRGTA